MFQRRNTRICLSIRITISCFLELSERCRAISGVIRGHLSLVDKGVINRDMALGNVMIGPTVKASRGMVIDLDHAKKQGTVSVGSDGRIGTPAFMAAEQLNPKLSIGRAVLDDPNDETDDDARDEIDAYFERKGRPKVQRSTAPIKRCGLHDIESVLWVLCYLCIFYTGPGEARNWSQESRDTRSGVWMLCDSGDWKSCATWKATMLSFRDDFEENVTGLFTPYLDPMKGLALAWREILHKSYHRRDERNIHQKFQKKIVKIEKYLAKQRPDTSALTEDQPTRLHQKRKVQAPEAIFPAFGPLHAEMERDFAKNESDSSEKALSPAIRRFVKGRRSTSDKVHQLTEGMERM